MTSYGAGTHLPRLTRHKNRRTITRAPMAPETKRAIGASLRMFALWMLGTTAVGLAGTGSYYGWRAAVDSKRLRVRTVEVTCNTRVSADELRAFTGVVAGQTLLGVDLDETALRLLRHPWIEQARVRRRLPDQIVLEVVERTPAILVSLGDVYLADGQGRLFKRLAAGDGVELPVVTGISREQAETEPEATASRVREAIGLAQAYGAVAARAGRLDELHLDPDLGWSILCSPGGDETLAYRMVLGAEPSSRLAAALAAVDKVRQSGEAPAVVFADGKKTPGRVQVRLRGAQDTRTLIANAK
jgi:cell division protein FtsQ